MGSTRPAQGPSTKRLSRHMAGGWSFSACLHHLLLDVEDVVLRWLLKATPVSPEAVAA